MKKHAFKLWLQDYSLAPKSSLATSINEIITTDKAVILGFPKTLFENNSK
jgi:hypothetical protein